MAFNIGSIEVLSVPIRPPENQKTYNGLQPGSTLFPRHYQHVPGAHAFEVDTVFDRDLPITLRDGVKIYADIYRPATTNAGEKVPALVAYSPYGKSGREGSFTLDGLPFRAGVLRSATSGLESFEGPDPALWTARGYAVCNIDSRGSFDSEGVMRHWGRAEGQDGADAIETIAELPWCTGNVATVGNSWLAVVQYFIAAEKPPHLRCFAPLEGQSDMYRESLNRGGVSAASWRSYIKNILVGRNGMEDPVGMLEKYPLYNEYWEDKRAKFDNIAIPAYVLASSSTALHTEGSLRAFAELRGPKWLRIHATHEWHDLYSKETTDDLQAFFDRYLKGIENKWEETPRARVSIIRFNKDPLKNIPFANFPVPNTDYKSLYLDATGNLTEAMPTDAGKLSYQSDAPYRQLDNDTDSELLFKYTFGKPAYIIGHPQVTLYMSTPDANDMAVYLALRKMDSSGRVLQAINMPLEDLGVSSEAEVPHTNVYRYLGPSGVIRASHRELDLELSRDHQPILLHRNPQPIEPKKVVRLNIQIWLANMAFEAGESLLLKVSGHDMRLADFASLAGCTDTGNKGRHVVHCGGRDSESKLVLPFVELTTDV